MYNSCYFFLNASLFLTFGQLNLFSSHCAPFPGFLPITLYSRWVTVGCGLYYHQRPGPAMDCTSLVRFFVYLRQSSLISERFVCVFVHVCVCVCPSVHVYTCMFFFHLLNYYFPVETPLLTNGFTHFMIGDLNFL